MKYLIPDKVYNVLKWVCIIALPLMAWAYGYFADIWGWIYPDQIVRTINGIATLLGGLIGISQITATKINEDWSNEDGR